MQNVATHILPGLRRKAAPFCLAVLLALLLNSCAHYDVITTWKAENIQFRNFNSFDKILVTGVVQDTNLRLRRQMEVHFAERLKGLGYNAVTSAEEFGPRGLVKMHQEQTYQKLCSNGIDAVLTIVLIDKKKEKHYMPARMKYYSDLFYYNRVWDYQKIQAGPINPNDSTKKSPQTAWECILLDLATLQPLYAIQSKPFAAATAEKEAQHYATEMVSLLVDKKVLVRQASVKAQPAANAF